MREHAAAMRSPSLVRSAFSLMLVYYWALQYAVTLDEPVQRGDVLYYFFVTPIAAFSLLALLAARAQRRVDPSVRWMLGYVSLVSLVAIARADFQTVISTALFGAGVIVILAFRLTPSVRVLNVLFLASILTNTLSLFAGRSIYAVLPGLSTGGDYWWRVSLFPHVATSAFFALIVLFVNMFHREAPLRRTCILLALYFLLLSGVRSALAAGLLAGLYLVLGRAGVFRRPALEAIYFIVSLALFVSALFATQLLLMLPDLGSETLNAFVFRSDNGLESESDVAKSVYRTWLWAEHMRIASENPVLGIGTFDFTTLADYDPMVGEWGTGSESFLTGLYARVGLPTLLAVAAFMAAMFQGFHPGGRLSFAIGLLMFVAMISYGSFINVYDFVFLVMTGLLVGRSPPQYARLNRRRPRAAPPLDFDARQPQAGGSS